MYLVYFAMTDVAKNTVIHTHTNSKHTYFISHILISGKRYRSTIRALKTELIPVSSKSDRR